MDINVAACNPCIEHLIKCIFSIIRRHQLDQDRSLTLERAVYNRSFSPKPPGEIVHAAMFNAGVTLSLNEAKHPGAFPLSCVMGKLTDCA